MLTLVALGGAAALAGLTGAWSPCGFSMMETIGAASRRSVLVAACATFAIGALGGGIATFGGLALLGAALPGIGTTAAVAVAAAAASVAAIAEARGVRIVPQVRRQVPEHWRRTLPLPIAAAGYGALLGLGFVTFVLTLAFWALAAIAFALGDVELGFAVGVGFGLGRALPIVLVAPFARAPLGASGIDLLAMRPGLLRSLRFADALALGGCAAVLLTGSAAAAVRIVARPAVDPSAAGEAFAWQGPDGGVVRLPADPADPASVPRTVTIAGGNTVLGGSLLAWREGPLVRVVRALDLSPVVDVLLARPADALAVSDTWLAYRQSVPGGGDRIAVRSIAATTDERLVASTPRGVALGRPSLDGGTLVFHRAGSSASTIVALDLDHGDSSVVRRTRLVQLSNPSVFGRKLLYVRHSNRSQQLLIGPLGVRGRDRVLLTRKSTATRDSGHEPGYSHSTRTPRAQRPARRCSGRRRSERGRRT